MLGGRTVSGTPSPVALVVLILVAGLTGAAGQQQQQPPPQPPAGAFRSRITIVPVDVRVLDSEGKPVTDLRQEDFTIREDGVVQTISHFSTQALIAEAVSPGDSARQPPLRSSPDAALKAQTRRVFLVLLGRGRLKGPAGELPALLDFVRTRLLPQDYVALLAWNRATDFTTDHAKVAAVIERISARSDKIEGMLDEHFSGLAAIYGAKEIPTKIQTEIDGVFDSVRALRPREIRPGQITDGAQISDDMRRTAQDLQRAELLRDRTGEFAGLPDPAATATADRLDMTFDEYIAEQVELTQDVGNLYAGIDYLRYIDGEKHLVFVTPRGLTLPRLENDRSIGRAASDARIAVDIIYTGGTAGAPPPRFAPVGSQAGPRIIMPPVPSAATMFRETFNIQSLRYVSELTGGQTTAFRHANYALDRLDQATRFQYLLGYAPKNTALDGRTRNLSVTVNRPGVTVLHRRGYFATNQLVPLDRRQFITSRRMTAAGQYTGVVRDIEVTLKPPTLEGTGTDRTLALEINLKSTRIAFADVDGRKTAVLDIGIYCGDEKQRLICDTLQKMDMKLSEAGYKVFQEQGASYTAKVRVNGEPTYVKVIAYDYAADVIGTALRKMK